MPKEKNRTNELNSENIFEMIDSSTFTMFIDLIPYNIYIQLNAQEVINLVKIMYEQENHARNKFCDKQHETFQFGYEYEQLLENRDTPVSYVTYTVKIRSENKFVRVLETFDNYSDAVMFIEKSDDIFSGQYFIIFTAYNADGNQICNGIVK